MRAWVLHGIDDLRLETAADPVLREGEALVAVRAAGICGSDIPRVYKTGAHVHPLIVGHEFSGVVEKVAGGVDPSWLGQRVGIFPLIPCRVCGPCQKKQYEMCRDYSYLGSRRDGGFAEYAAVPADNMIRLPDLVTFEEAAMLEPMAVAVHAIRRIRVSAGETVAVCGLGTIGLLLVMFLREAGVERIFAVGNKEFQRQAVLKMGLPENAYCDVRSQEAGRWLAERTDGNGVDVFFECVGKNETLMEALEYAAPAGRVMLVGNPFTDMHLDKQVYWRILRAQLTVAGTWNSSFTHDPEDDWHYVLDRLASGRIDPAGLITHRSPLEGLERGLRIMRDKTEEYCKIMVV